MEKYTIGKKSAQGDRAVPRRTDAPLALTTETYHARMPFLATGITESDEDLYSQRDCVSAYVLGGRRADLDLLVSTSP